LNSVSGVNLKNNLLYHNTGNALQLNGSAGHPLLKPLLFKYRGRPLRHQFPNVAIASNAFYSNANPGIYLTSTNADTLTAILIFVNLSTGVTLLNGSSGHTISANSIYLNSGDGVLMDSVNSNKLLANQDLQATSGAESIRLSTPLSAETPSAPIRSTPMARKGSSWSAASSAIR